MESFVIEGGAETPPGAIPQIRDNAYDRAYLVRLVLFFLLAVPWYYLAADFAGRVWARYRPSTRALLDELAALARQKKHE